MTNRKDGPDKAPQRPAGDAGKRIHATIDLKATEVAADAKTAAAAAADSATSAARIAEAAATVAAGKPAAGGATATAGGGASGGATSAASGDTGKSAGAPAAGKPTSTPSTSTPPTGGKTADSSPAAPAASAKGAATASAAAASSSTASATPPPPPVRKRGGFLSHLVAAAVGGAIVLLGAEHLRPQLAELGLVPPPASPPLAKEAADRLAALEKSLAARGTAPAAPSTEVAQKLAAAEQRLARLEESAKAIAPMGEAQAKLSAETKALAEKVAAGGPAGGAGVGERVTKLEETLATLSRAATTDPERAGRLPQLAAITGKLADLEQALTSRATTLRRDLLQEVETRIGSATEAGEAARSGTTRLDREVAQMRTDAARVGQRLEALKAGSDRLEQTLRVVQEETGTLRAGLDGLKGDVEAKLAKVARPDDVQKAVTPVAGKIAALEKSVAGVVAAEADRRQNAERIVLALELANLKRAMERGTGFAAELAEVKRVSGGKLDLAALQAHQEKGVATLSDLARDFRPLVSRILDAEAEDEEAGVVDRLLSGARSIVRVRKTTHAASDTSLEAVVGRMEKALHDGRLGDVVKAATGLSEKAKAPAAAWLGKVGARQSVDKALADIEATLKASLGATAAEKGTR
jgi:uncharacterized protein YoxC